MTINLDSYEEIINMSPKSSKPVLLTRNIKTGQMAVKRYIDTDNISIYEKLQNINNSHIPHIYEIFKDCDNIFVLEEYINGKNLSNVLENTTFDVNKVKKYTVQLCNALIDLHENDIIHRDIKPENIILTGEGKLVLIDYDIARIHKGSQSMDTKFFGTPEYASPEHFGFKETDMRSDIYSLGVLMNKMLTGKFPHEQLHSGTLEDIIRKCIEISPDNRYSNVFLLKTTLLGLNKQHIQVFKDDIYNKTDIVRRISNGFCVLAIGAVLDIFTKLYWGFNHASIFDCFAEISRKYLPKPGTLKSIKEVITIIPSPQWFEMGLYFVSLMAISFGLRFNSMFSKLLLSFWIIYDMRFQISGFINNTSTVYYNSGTSFYDVVNFVSHLIMIGGVVYVHWCDMQIKEDKQLIQKLKEV